MVVYSKFCIELCIIGLFCCKDVYSVWAVLLCTGVVYAELVRAISDPSEHLVT